MSAVLTFWQLPGEEEDIVSFVESTGDVVAVPCIYVSDMAMFDPTSFRDYVRTFDATACSIGLRHRILANGIAEREVNGKRLYGLPARSEYISYSRPTSLRGHLLRSNLYAEWDYLSSDNTTLIKKDPDFRLWASKVFAWVRGAVRQSALSCGDTRTGPRRELQ